MSYIPFAISKFTTGQFQYFQPWISPEDAFNPLVNAYIFRGSINKRNGRKLFGETGQLRYQNNEIIAFGNSGTSIDGFLSATNIEMTGFSIIATIDPSTIETYIDNAQNGILVGNAGGSGTIDYTTGQWSITTIVLGGYVSGFPIVANYTFTSTGNPIVLITEFVNEVSDLQFAVVNDTRRSAIFNTATDLFDPISTFSQFLWFGDGVSTTFSFSTFGWTNIAPYSISITDGSNTITDIPGVYPAGTFTTAGNFAAGSIIDYSTGAITVNFTVAPATSVVITISGSLQGDYYTGGRANLFNSTNWKPSDGAPGLLYMTNNVDQVTTFDGTNLSRLPYGITEAHVNGAVNDISTTLDIKVYQDSLLFIRPTLVSAAQPEGQTIRWSGPASPTNFAADVAGPTNGGFKNASTSDWIQSASFLRDAMVIDCDNSTFLFRFTNNNFDPFRFDKINSTKSNNAPYGSVEYDTQVTSMGAKGLCYCDGVNKDRYDLNIIDIFNDIDFNNFALAQGRRFDQIQQTWMIYASIKREQELNCDKVLVYNWLEETWATYKINLTCIGSARTFNDQTWDEFAGLTWNEAYPPGTTWDQNFNQDLVPWMLGGDADGYVYFLNQNDFDYDVNVNTDPDDAPYQYQANIQAQLVSKRWNPFVEQGMKATFGYIDFYYMVNPQIKLTINYYINNGTIPALTQILTLDGTISDAEQSSSPDPVSDQQFAWKRMYCQLTGQFLRMEILSSSSEKEQGQFIISGLVLWARAAGRLTPGLFL